MRQRQHPIGKGKDPTAQTGRGKDPPAPADPGRMGSEVCDHKADPQRQILRQHPVRVRKPSTGTGDRRYIGPGLFHAGALRLIGGNPLRIPEVLPAGGGETGPSPEEALPDEKRLLKLPEAEDQGGEDP